MSRNLLEDFVGMFPTAITQQFSEATVNIGYNFDVKQSLYVFFRKN